MPSTDETAATQTLTGAGLPVLYLDYDGPLHNEAVYWDQNTKRPFMSCSPASPSC